MQHDWYSIRNESEIDSPALLIYVDRVRSNIQKAIERAGSVDRLRPHVKTHKSPQVSRMMLDAGISKFKCATIAEAEMLGAAKAKDVLLAYQPSGPKIARLVELIEEFPSTIFSCLVDNLKTASEISSAALNANTQLPVYIDVNVGMNRTGVEPQYLKDLVRDIKGLRGIQLLGLHVYDGHLRDSDFSLLKKKCDEAFATVDKIRKQSEQEFGLSLKVIAGGTPTFSIHCSRPDIECSPGTFIYWDSGYENMLTEQDYDWSAVILARVVSKPAAGIICVDVGHKAIASENPLDKRISFLNAPGLTPIGHSEEHMTFQTKENFEVGDVLYGVPYHVCPTVALHDNALAVINHEANDTWHNISRNRKITI